MDYLKTKFKQLEKALTAWETAIKTPYTDIARDATIQRYEFTFELLWKVLKIYLKEQEGIECTSPKSCFREARNSLNLKEKEIELALQMTDNRNLSVHTYSEKMAADLYKKSKTYYSLAKKISVKIKKSIKNS